MQAQRLNTRVTALLLSLAAAAAVPAQAPVVRATPADLAQRLTKVEQQLQNQGLLNMLQQLESIQADLNQLRGDMEVMKRDIEELNKRQRAMYTDIDQRLQGLAPTPAADLTTITAGPGAAGSPPLQTLSPSYDANAEVTAPAAADNALNIQMMPSAPATQTPPVVTTSGDQNTLAVLTPTPAEQPGTGAPLTGPAPANATTAAVVTGQAVVDPVQMQAEYDRAFNLLKQSQYDPAIQSFTDYLNKYPTGGYADNAQYWLGEAYYVTRRFEQALQEYNKLVVNYPQSQKYTHALLKIGYCYHELGRIDEARKYLQALVRQYPGETASRLAEERLKSIALTEQQSGAPQN